MNSCLNPIAIEDTRDYETETFGKLFLPCGKCENCRNNDSLQWRIRLKEEFYDSENAFFITLTYDDSFLHFEPCYNNNDFLGFFPCVNRKDIQNFLKRLRFKYEDYYKSTEKKLKYFLVSEYGPSTFRPHYHAIFFNLPLLSDIPEVNIVKLTKKIQEIWGLGFIKLDKCNEARIGYCTKYMSCITFIPPYLVPPFRLISKGLGKCYLKKKDRILWHKKDLNNYYPEGNIKMKLPRYLKDKIFSDDEKVMISQLSSIRESERIEKEKLEFKNMNAKTAHNFKTSIEKIKRDYKNKSIKNRKDL